MRTAVFEDTRSSVSDEWLTTGEAARLLGVSRQHVVNLCERGDLPHTTTGVHRRVRRADVEALRATGARLSRDQRRSLWLAHAVAGHLVTDPETTIAQARANLAVLRERHSRGQVAKWLAEWADLLDGPVEGVLTALTSPSPRARELRQNSPFAAVLSEEERRRVREAFAQHSSASSPWGAE
ncbi:helix-turn-helix domain-containing protein [Kineococcus esterisolvens]|uniref:helix-turn-helix domain-containing protein n=1 Tax=unclassified Kineococcus TaxID=2621656 RepID=UPI003D7E0BE2